MLQECPGPHPSHDRVKFHIFDSALLNQYNYLAAIDLKLYSQNDFKSSSLTAKAMEKRPFFALSTLLRSSYAFLVYTH